MCKGGSMTVCLPPFLGLWMLLQLVPVRLKYLENMQIYIRSITEITKIYSSVYHRKAPMAEDNGLPAFLQTPIFQAIFNTLKGTASNNKAPPVETVGENSELINVESNDSPGRTGYLRSMMT